MNNESDSTASGLLRCFFLECERKFRFLEQKHGFEYISGLAAYKNAYRIIRPYHGQEIDAAFLAMTRYEKDGYALEIVYGGQDMALELYSCHERILRFTPAEILTAARKYGGGLAAGRGVAQEGMIEDILARFSRAFGKYPKILLDPPPHIVDRARSIREKHLEQAVRKHYRLSLEQAVRQAAKAYREKDFLKVVHLLEPHRAALGGADLKKLHLARARLRG